MHQANQSSRRDFLAAGLAGTSAGLMSALPSTGAATSDPSKDAVTPVKVRFDELLPHEFRRRLAERPIAYLPLGTLEWHGEHLPLGSDAIQSEGLMVQCARQLGGIVMPPIHLGPDLVDLSQLPQARSTWPQGVGGEDPRDATPGHGKECLQKSVELVRQVFAKAGLL